MDHHHELTTQESAYMTQSNSHRSIKTSRAACLNATWYYASKRGGNVTFLHAHSKKNDILWTKIRMNIWDIGTVRTSTDGKWGKLSVCYFMYPSCQGLYQNCARIWSFFFWICLQIQNKTHVNVTLSIGFNKWNRKDNLRLHWVNWSINEGEKIICRKHGNLWRKNYCF